MKPSKVNRQQLHKLTDLPNVGPQIANDLQRLGYQTPQQLIGADPLKMYQQLTTITGQQHDPCMLDVFMAITDFMAGNPAQDWWHYTPLRKQHYR